jgi:hypothetical protein
MSWFSVGLNGEALYKTYNLSFWHTDQKFGHGLGI